MFYSLGVICWTRMCFKDSEKDFTKNNLVNFWDEGKHVISQEWEDSSDLTSNGGYDIVDWIRKEVTHLTGGGLRRMLIRLLMSKGWFWTPWSSLGFYS